MLERELDTSVWVIVMYASSAEEAERVIRALKNAGVRHCEKEPAGQTIAIMVPRHYANLAWAVLSLGVHGRMLSVRFFEALRNAMDSLESARLELLWIPGDPQPRELPEELVRANAELGNASTIIWKVQIELGGYLDPRDEIPDSVPEKPGFERSIA